MDRPLHVRIATREDLPTLIQLYAEMDGDAPLTEAIATSVFDQISQVPNYQIYIAYWDEAGDQQPVGTFGLLIIPTMMHRGFHKSALLDAVSVSPAYRNQGIGKAMMLEALNISRAAGCYKVMLSSNLKRDRAHAFYESLGFQQHGWSFSLKL